MRRATFILLAGLVLTAGLARMAWVGYHLPSGPPDVAIHVLGYTNDPVGTRFAVVGITNLDPRKIFAYAPIVEVSNAASPSGLDFAPPHRPIPWHTMLASAGSDRFVIPVPTNEPQWRVRLSVYDDVNLQAKIQRIISRSARRMPYSFRSEWIETEK